jgi:hypothetical protein
MIQSVYSRIERKRASLFFLIIIVIGFSAILTTQPVTAKGNIWGYIRDANTFTPIASALFEAIPQEQGAVQAHAYTNAQGYFELIATQGKMYRFKVSANGYLPSETATIIVPSDRELPFDSIPLQKAPTTGFGIQPVVGNAAVVTGEKGTYTIMLIAAPQFSGFVSISIRSSIASTGYMILPNNTVELKSPNNSTVNIIVSTERNTLPGTYDFVVTATSGEVTQTAIMTLTVYAAQQTLQEQIRAAILMSAPLVSVCAVSVVVGFLIGRRKSGRSKLLTESSQ